LDRQTLIRRGLGLFVLFVAGQLFVQTTQAALQPAQLRCEYAVNPLGVDLPQPNLSWKLESPARGQRQTAFQILVASSPEILANHQGDLWDSGKVASDETIHIRYAGNELNSAQPVFWKVRVWDANGKLSAWSKRASWTMGVLNETDWQAKWIGAQDTNNATLLLRHEFVVKPGLRRALVNVCGLGEYEMSLNGKKVGEDLFPSGWTDYRKTCLYDTHDITALLRKGKNAAGIFLGPGMYHVIGVTNRFTKFKGSFGPLKAIAQLRLEYPDGSIEFIGTDDQWRVAPGPITFCSVYGGEDFDARLVQRDWDKPGFDDSKWPPAQIVNGPGGELKGLSCAAPPIRAFEIHKPVATSTLTNGDVLFDLGQNASHMLRLSVSGPAGTLLRIFPAELTNADGTINQGSMGGGRRGPVFCEFTKATDSVESFAPKFFYVGCRYVQAHFANSSPGVATLSPSDGERDGVRGKLLRIKSLEGVVVHSASQPVGEFECSNPLFNRIRRLVRWAQRSNMMSLMTDCPHRERLGWLEEDHLNGPSLRYEFDLAQLFTKQMNDMADAQTEDGLIPDIAPEYTVFKGGFRDSPEWGSAYILVPWQQYEFDGDLDLLRRHYDGMKRYVAYLGSRSTNHIADFGLGDWYDIGPRAPGVAQLTPIALTATAFYFYDTWILSQTAALLGKADEAKQFSDQAEIIRGAFNEKFFNATNHDYSTGSQTANSIPLVMNLCEPSNRAAVLEAVVRDVRSRGNAITAGDVGYRYLLRALAEGGRSDVIFDMNNQSEKPGYGYQLKMGATSLTEAWDARRGSSQNHFMLGQIQEWFYHDLAGIRSDPAGPGFKKILIAPQPVGDLTWVKAGYDSIRGKIVSDWKRDGEKFTLRVRIPANTTATIFLPAKSTDGILAGGKPAAQSKGVKFLRQEKDRAVFAVESGEYKFESKF
jgi:alpha-L-rhamnosidase